jgi:hypothetical protein
VENFFNQMLYVKGVHDVRQMTIHTTEPLVSEPILELEIAFGKLKTFKSQGTDNIPAELIKAGVKKSYYEIHTLIYSTRNKEKLPQQWKKSNYCTNLYKG